MHVSRHIAARLRLPFAPSSAVPCGAARLAFIALLMVGLVLGGCAPRKKTASLPERPTYVREAAEQDAAATGKGETAVKGAAEPAAAPPSAQPAAPELVTTPRGATAARQEQGESRTGKTAQPTPEPARQDRAAPPDEPMVELADGTSIKAPTTPRDQFAYAMGLLQNDDGKPDPARAVPWLEKAAARNFGPAQDVLARMYLDGVGVPQDEAKGFTLAMSAARQEVINAQALVGMLYTYGRGTKRDFLQGEKWLSLAAERGHPQACDLVAEYYRKGLAGPKDMEQAFRWTERAATLGVPRARFWLGVHHRYAMGTPRDEAAALRLLREAADAGNPDAMGLVAEMFYQGQGVEPDIASAVRYFQMGDKAGDQHSRLNLGILHHEGRGVPKDFGRSLQLFAQCAEGGHPRCMTLLGSMLASGEGTGVDTVTAHSWLVRAMLFGDGDAAPVVAEVQQRMTPDQEVHSKNITAQWMQEHPQFQPVTTGQPAAQPVQRGAAKPARPATGRASAAPGR